MAVCKMAEFVCHTPDHNKGGKVKMVTTRRVGEEKNEEGKGGDRKYRRLATPLPIAV